MAIEISGILIQKLPQQTGQGKNGPWIKQEFIIETQEQINRKICVSCWGDKADSIHKYAIGDSLKLSVNIESREYNGRWYTDVRAWKIDSGNVSVQSLNTTSEFTPKSNPADSDCTFTATDDGADDLPF